MAGKKNRKIRVLNMISLDGEVYHPLEELDEATLERARSTTKRKISSRRITDSELAEFRERAVRKISRCLSEYYSEHLDEFERL